MMNIALRTPNSGFPTYDRLAAGQAGRLRYGPLATCHLPPAPPNGGRP